MFYLCWDPIQKELPSLKDDMFWLFAVVAMNLAVYLAIFIMTFFFIITNPIDVEDASERPKDKRS